MSTKIQGFSLIEVLVSLLLLALALFGYDAMEIRAVQASRANYFFNVAVNQMQVMTERLQVARDAAEVVSMQNVWNQQNAEALPQGKGIVQQNGITLVWGEYAASDCVTIEIGQAGCVHQKLRS